MIWSSVNLCPNSLHNTQLIFPKIQIMLFKGLKKVRFQISLSWPRSDLATFCFCIYLLDPRQFLKLDQTGMNYRDILNIKHTPHCWQLTGTVSENKWGKGQWVQAENFPFYGAWVDPFMFGIDLNDTWPYCVKASQYLKQILCVKFSSKGSHSGYNTETAPLFLYL